MKVLVTGAAGFIGAGVCEKLLGQNHQVVGVDNIYPYYDTDLKEDRLKKLESSHFSFHKIDIADYEQMLNLFKQEKPTHVVHLAAQPGVRWDKPQVYAQTNLIGHLNILECCRHNPVEHLVYASSSSVYGDNEEMPFSETDQTNQPASLYAATKMADEHMSRVYAKLHNVASSGLRFFTVYGPWGRPDMSPCLFAGKMLRGEQITIFNKGEMKRDFTYIDDIVEGIVRLTAHKPTNKVPHEVYNIGNNQPVPLMDFVAKLEKAFGIKANIYFDPEPKLSEVMATYANTDKLEKAVGFKPNTSLDEGLERFATWYKDYYKEDQERSLWSVQKQEEALSKFL